MTQTDLVGAIGVTILLVAFFLNITDKIKKNSFSYLTMNFIGASIACLASVLMNYWPFIILEGCWAVVSGFGIFSYYKSK